MKKILDFLKELKKNNNREWFGEHKGDYEDVKREVEELTRKLLAGMAEFEPRAAMMVPADCLYRIYRDTRFSPDKTPYKTHIGIYISPIGGKKSEYAGYYLHIEPGNCMVAGGSWCPPMPLLKEIRSEIYANVDEYLEIIENPEFKAAFPIVGEDLLKTAPKGYPKDWEHIDLLKPRSYVAYSLLSDREILRKDLAEEVVDRFRMVKPLNDFFNYTIEEHPELADCRPVRR